MKIVRGVYTTEDLAPFYYCGVFTAEIIFYFSMKNGDVSMSHYYSLERFNAEEEKRIRKWLEWCEIKQTPFSMGIEDEVYAALQDILDREERVEVSFEPPKKIPEKYSLFLQLEQMIQKHIGKVSY